LLKTKDYEGIYGTLGDAITMLVQKAWAVVIEVQIRR
jgi:hypothetical protein